MRKLEIRIEDEGGGDSRHSQGRGGGVSKPRRQKMPTAADGTRPPTGAGGTEAVSAGRLGGKSPRTLPGAAGPEAA